MSVGKERDFVEFGGMVIAKSQAAVCNDVAEPTSAATGSDFAQLYPGPSDLLHTAIAVVPAAPQPVGPRALPDALEGSHVESTALGTMELRPEATNAASVRAEATNAASVRAEVQQHQSAGDCTTPIGIMSASLRALGERHTDRCVAECGLRLLASLAWEPANKVPLMEHVGVVVTSMTRHAGDGGVAGHGLLFLTILASEAANRVPLMAHLSTAVGTMTQHAIDSYVGRHGLKLLAELALEPANGPMLASHGDFIRMVALQYGRDPGIQVPHVHVTHSRRLGMGAFGEVDVVEYNQLELAVAVKCNCAACADTCAIDNERQLYDKLRLHPHENILMVYGIPDGNARLVMNRCENGSLADFLTSTAQAQVRAFSASPFNTSCVVIAFVCFCVLTVCCRAVSQWFLSCPC
jgi:hypothetical protein